MTHKVLLVIQEQEYNYNKTKKSYVILQIKDKEAH